MVHVRGWPKMSFRQGFRGRSPRSAAATVEQPRPRPSGVANPGADHNSFRRNVVGVQAISVPDVHAAVTHDRMGTGTLDERVALFERDIIVDAIKRTFANMAAVARDLGTTPRILRYKVKQLNIDHRRFCRTK